MASLVLDVQRRAMDRDARVSDVVRAALVVATKLDIAEFKDWCEAELHGYTGLDVPSYRQIEGQLKAWNPARGWIPVAFQDPANYRALATRAVVQSLGELEELYRGSDDKGFLQIPLAPSVLQRIFGDTQEYRLGIIPTVLIGRNQVFGVLEAVRNAVLEWSLRLEKDGILGEDLTFSPEERQRAGAVVYHIQNFTGVLGDVRADTLQIGDYNSIHAALKQRGVSQEDRNELEAILDKLPKATPNERKSLISRGGAWLQRNGPLIGTLSETIRGWFEHLSR